jgi:hypothetical protein
VEFFIELETFHYYSEVAGSYPPPSSVSALASIVIGVSKNRGYATLIGITRGEEVVSDQGIIAQIPTNTRRAGDRWCE